MSRANEPAYPVTLKELREIAIGQPPALVDCQYGGLTIRERFALAAMQGIITSIAHGPGVLIHEQEVASDAVAYADALISELSRSPSREGVERG